jgi:histone deacetylase 11
VKPVLVYSPGYDISLFGLDRLHPFDGRKFSRAWSLVRDRLGVDVERVWERPAAPVEDEVLLGIHTPAYLASLSSPAVVARALEVGALKFLPNAVVRRRLLDPMRLAVAGTVLATKRALEGDGAMAMNVGGGFHHAFRDHGEGFCIYADVAAAIAAARASGALAVSDPIAIIDLDAHRGNGVWSICGADPAISILDLYNFQIYPGLFDGSPDDFPFQVPIKAMTDGDTYLRILNEELPRFFDAMPKPRLAFYNAGTDILAGDPVGRMAVSAEQVAARDRLIVRSMAERGIPTVVVTSGGYTRQSHRLIARLAIDIVETCLDTGRRST